MIYFNKGKLYYNLVIVLILFLIYLISCIEEDNYWYKDPIYNDEILRYNNLGLNIKIIDLKNRGYDFYIKEGGLWIKNSDFKIRVFFDLKNYINVHRDFMAININEEEFDNLVVLGYFLRKKPGSRFRLDDYLNGFDYVKNRKISKGRVIKIYRKKYKEDYYYLCVFDESSFWILTDEFYRIWRDEYISYLD